jgi:methylmalonyl-CoA/ethylmalonyl-CoA epimerase
MFKRIDHVAIAVENLDEAVRLYEERFGLNVGHRESIESYGVETATFDIGGTSVELVEGKNPDSPIRKYIERHGPGIHHICYEVEDIEEALAKLKAASVKLIDDKPQRGKDNSLVAFIHPDATQHILYELVQKKSTP